MAMMAVMIIGAVVSAASAIQQGKAAKQAADFNVAMAERNQGIAASQTEASLIQQRRSATKQLGSMRASFSAAGVTMEGSALEIISESAGQAELDSQNIRYNGILKAQGYQADASLERARGENALQAGYMNAASSALSSAGKMYGMGSTGGGMALSSSSGGSIPFNASKSQEYYG